MVPIPISRAYPDIVFVDGENKDITCQYPYRERIRTLMIRLQVDTVTCVPIPISRAYPDLDGDAFYDKLFVPIPISRAYPDL